MRGRQVVWSDATVQALAKNFVVVAEEVFEIYPEGEWLINQRKGDPAFEFFKAYGAQVPKDQWHEPGTKQGIYFMGPNGEYLEARFASSNAADIAAKARRALERWETLRKEKGYANKPIPYVETRLPEKELENNDLVFQVNLRDLPRDPNGKVTKFEQVGNTSEGWRDFQKWAWNENWHGTYRKAAYVTSSATSEEVDPGEWRTVCKMVLVDNVRGQAPTWDDGDIKSAKLTKRRIAVKDGKWVIEYRGSAEMRRGSNSFTPTVYGQGVWDPKTSSFDKLELVATGDRSGAWQFNNRQEDRGPAPMGITLVLYK